MSRSCFFLVVHSEGKAHSFCYHLPDDPDQTAKTQDPADRKKSGHYPARFWWGANTFPYYNYKRILNQKFLTMVRIFLFLSLLFLLVRVSAQEPQQEIVRKKGTFWQSHTFLTPFRFPLPDPGSVHYLDLDGDGDPDVLRAFVNGYLPVQWIDDDDDMKEGDLEGDTDSDCLMIDRDGDGHYGGKYDLMIDWDDDDGDGEADLQVIADNNTWNARRGKYMSHYMIFVDTDHDGVFNYIDWNKYAIEAWDRMGRALFLPDYNGQSLFLKTHSKVSDIADLRYNWENPFLFYDKDGDGLTEMTIRFCDDGLPVSRRQGGPRDPRGRPYRKVFSHRITGVYVGIDLDNDSEAGNELDFDMSLKFTGEGFDYSDFFHSHPSMRGLPAADTFFGDARWRRLTGLIYVPHEEAWPIIFSRGKWQQCWLVFDEDDDCHRWERVEFYDPKDPFRVGAHQGGLDDNPQADVSGDRGEWDLDFSGGGDLYLAPFDGRLHLVGAELGYWRIDQFAYYYQGWQGWRGPSIAPEDLVDKEPEHFATVRYEDTDHNGFFDLIRYDLDGDTLYEETISLKELDIDDSRVIRYHTADLSYGDLRLLFAEMARSMWRNALQALRVARRYGLETSWYNAMRSPRSLQEQYSWGYWIAFYLHKDLVQHFRSLHDEEMVRRVLHAYYASSWDELLNDTSCNER